MADLLSPIWTRPDGRPPSFTPREWEALLGQARRAGLMARLSLHFLDRGWLTSVPPQARLYLDAAVRVVDRQRHAVLWEVDQIRRVLQSLQTPVVLLKGAAYLVAGLPPSRGRLFSDIDIMVDAGKLSEVERTLFTAGWISSERDAYNQRYYRQWMHEIPPLQHVRRGSIIDLHHTIAPPTSRFKVDAAKLFQRARRAGSSGLLVLAPVDMVLHSATHLFQEGEFDHGLRDLLDLRDLITEFGKQPDFWPDLFRRSHDLGLREPLFYALDQIERIFGSIVPVGGESDFKQLSSGRLSRILTIAALNLALRPNHPECASAGTAMARWFLYVRSHYLRMPVHILVPHLVRKAYMGRFPEQGPRPAVHRDPAG